MKHKIEVGEMEWKEGNVKGFMGKSLITQKNGTVKLVRVSPLANYPLHLHPDKTEYAFVVEGNPHFEIDSEEHQAHKGDFFVFPTGTKHAIRDSAPSSVVKANPGITRTNILMKKITASESITELPIEISRKSVTLCNSYSAQAGWPCGPDRKSLGYCYIIYIMLSRHSFPPTIYISSNALVPVLHLNSPLQRNPGFESSFLTSPYI